MISLFFNTSRGGDGSGGARDPFSSLKNELEEVSESKAKNIHTFFCFSFYSVLCVSVCTESKLCKLYKLLCSFPLWVRLWFWDKQQNDLQFIIWNMFKNSTGSLRNAQNNIISFEKYDDEQFVMNFFQIIWTKRKLDTLHCLAN